MSGASASLRNCCGEMLTETTHGRPASSQRLFCAHAASQHPLADLADEADLLGDGDERRGRHHAAARHVPANQSLCTDDLAAS